MTMIINNACKHHWPEKTVNVFYWYFGVPILLRHIEIFWHEPSCCTQENIREEALMRLLPSPHVGHSITLNIEVLIIDVEVVVVIVVVVIIIVIVVIIVITFHPNRNWNLQSVFLLIMPNSDKTAPLYNFIWNLPVFEWRPLQQSCSPSWPPGHCIHYCDHLHKHLNCHQIALSYL